LNRRPQTPYEAAIGWAMKRMSAFQSQRVGYPVNLLFVLAPIAAAFHDVAAFVTWFGLRSGMLVEANPVVFIHQSLSLPFWSFAAEQTVAICVYFVVTLMLALRARSRALLWGVIGVAVLFTAFCAADGLYDLMQGGMLAI